MSFLGSLPLGTLNIDTGAQIIASACPYCNTMLTDGVKLAEKEDSVKVMDIAELIAQSMNRES